jgi:hypothetical protein
VTLLPGGTLHFCVASSNGAAVRTIEWRSKQVGTGRRPLDLDAWREPD